MGVGRPKKNAGDVRSKQITINVTPAEYEQLKEAAEQETRGSLSALGYLAIYKYLASKSKRFGIF